MKLAKRLGYKIIVVLCILSIFCSFIASTPVHASKVNKTGFYYSGTSKGSYTVNKGLLEYIIEALGMILDYLLGLMTMGFRMIFVGWTALFERSLTLIIQGLSGESVEVDGVSPTSLFSADGWITLDAIFFNHVSILDINFFKFEKIEGYDSTGNPIEGHEDGHDAPMIIYTEEIENEDGEKGTVEVTVVQGEKNKFHPAVPVPIEPGDSPTPPTDEDESLILIFKRLIAGWYYTLRLIAIMAMLVILVYLGIQLAIKSVATDKAVYKKMLMDWLVGMILIFTLHYIMLGIINVNEMLVDQISKLRRGATPLAVYEYGLEERATKPITNDELERTLYDEVKTRAYDLKMSVGTTGMIMYMVLVYYAWKFTFVYLKRYLTIAVLIIMAPIVSASYAFTKIRTGKGTIFSKWLKEFTFTVMLQSIHALMYVVFVQTALGLSLGSISSFILVLMLFNFMGKADGLFRKIFNIGEKGGGGVFSEVADGQGLRDTMKAATNIVALNEVKKAAGAWTKGVANLATKPARALGEAGFKAYMRGRGHDLDVEARNAGYDTYTDYKKAKRAKRTRALEVGQIMEQVESGEINVDEMQERVNSLKIGDAIKDANGNITGVVDQAYIDGEQEKVDNIRAVIGMTDAEKASWQAEYDAMHSSRTGKFKALSIALSEKWEDILDPTNYNKAKRDADGNVVRDEEGYVVYDSIEKQKKGLKVIDSAGKRLAKRLSWQNLLDVSDEEKKALEQQVDLVKSEIKGFGGILIGLPMLVADPTAGMAMMTVGIANTSRAFSGSPVGKMRSVAGFKLDAKGNYVFNRFEGKSKSTIAHGARAMAEAQMEEIARSKYEEEVSVKKRFEQRHPRMAAMLRDNKLAEAGRIGVFGATEYAGLAAFQAMHIAGVTVLGAPPVAMAAGAVATASFTGKILKESPLMDNAWGRYQETMRIIRKEQVKAQEKREKDAGLDDFMDVLAEHYFDMEEAEFEEDAKRHAAKFEDEYVATLLAMELAVEEKTDEEVLRDSGFDTEIEEGIKRDEEGSAIQISQAAEDKLIENAILTYAVQTGATDITQIVIEDKQSQITEILKADMVTRGLSEDSEAMKTVMDNLEKKMKDAQVRIQKDDKGESAIRDKMAGDAIVSTMKEKGVTDVAEVSDEEILQKFTETFEARASAALDSSRRSNDVLSALASQKGSEEPAAVPQAFDMDKFKEAAKVSIQARKTSFADRAKQGIDTAVADQIKDTLKKKQKLELDKQIYAKEEELSTQTSVIGDMAVNANGGLDSSADGSSQVTFSQPTPIEGSSAEDIVRMIDAQTQLDRAKKNKELVKVKRGSAGRDERVSLYKEMHMIGESGGEVDISRDGSRRGGTSDARRAVNSRRDGSQRVGATSEREAPILLDIDDILKKNSY